MDSKIGKTVSFGDGRRFKLISANKAVAEFPSGHRALFYRNTDTDDYDDYGDEWTHENLSDWYSSIDEATQAYRDAFPNLTEK